MRFVRNTGYNEALAQQAENIKQLQVDYVDLLLIHWPGPPVRARRNRARRKRARRPRPKQNQAPSLCIVHTRTHATPCSNSSS